VDDRARGGGENVDPAFERRTRAVKPDVDLGPVHWIGFPRAANGWRKAPPCSRARQVGRARLVARAAVLSAELVEELRFRTIRHSDVISPNADHWSGHAIGRSIRRLTPKPRGSRPSIRRFGEGGAKESGTGASYVARPTKAGLRGQKWPRATRVPKASGWSKMDLAMGVTTARIRRELLCPSEWNEGRKARHSPSFAALRVMGSSILR
jgi:hypothetical protein